MEQLRKEQLSIYYWLVDLLPSFVTVVSEFPEGELTLPTVSVTNVRMFARPFQLGSSDDLYKRNWAIDVFAQNSGQRDDYLELIHDSLKNGICTYNYDVGFPPTVTPPQIGSLYVEERESKPLRVYEDLVKKKFWWGKVLFRTYHTPI
jgi:hypothetical protein